MEGLVNSAGDQIKGRLIHVEPIAALSAGVIKQAFDAIQRYFQVAGEGILAVPV
jgi:hypothetical protein